MIYTVTFNPSLDYVVQADQLIPGDINRTTSEHIYPGGKRKQRICDPFQSGN